MRCLDCQRGSQELMECRICDVLRISVNQTGCNIRRVFDTVDFIECEVVLYLTGKSFETCLGIFDERADKMSVVPAVVLRRKSERCFIVGQCNQRFDAVFLTFIEYIGIELDSFFIRYFIVTVREQSGPFYRETQAVESFFRAELNVFLVVMLEVGSDVRRVVVFGIIQKTRYGAFRQMPFGTAETERC